MSKVTQFVSGPELNPSVFDPKSILFPPCHFGEYMTSVRDQAGTRVDSRALDARHTYHLLADALDTICLWFCQGAYKLPLISSCLKPMTLMNEAIPISDSMIGQKGPNFLTYT